MDVSPNKDTPPQEVPKTEALPLDDEEEPSDLAQELFESEDLRRWREAYEDATNQYSEEFLSVLTDPELLTRIMNTWEN